MSLWIVVPVVMANFVLVLLRPRAGVGVYVTLALVLPHPAVGGAAVAYEILALPMILIAAAVRRPWLEHPRFHLFLGAYLSLLILSTIVGTTTYGTDIDIIRFQGVVRFVVLLGLVRELLDRDLLERVFLAVVTINAGVGFSQLLVPGLGRIFLRLYGRTGQAVLEAYALEDFIPRASGTFSSPVVLGALALIALAVAWAGLLVERRGPRYGWLLMSAAIAGIVSLTKTFLIGAPIILAGGVALAAAGRGARPFGFRPRTLAVALAAGAAALGLALWTGGILDRLGFDIAYYAGFVLDPRAAFATRYGPGGTLGEAVAVVADNPLLGVGITRVRGEFIGDSTYTVLLHSTGLAGAVLMLLALAATLHAIRSRRRPTDLLVLGALLLAGLALPIGFSLPGGLALAYLFVKDGTPRGGPSGGFYRIRYGEEPEPQALAASEPLA